MPTGRWAPSGSRRRRILESGPRPRPHGPRRPPSLLRAERGLRAGSARPFRSSRSSRWRPASDARSAFVVGTNAEGQPCGTVATPCVGSSYGLPWLGARPRQSVAKALGRRRPGAGDHSPRDVPPHDGDIRHHPSPFLPEAPDIVLAAHDFRKARRRGHHLGFRGERWRRLPGRPRCGREISSPPGKLRVGTLCHLGALEAGGAIFGRPGLDEHVTDAGRVARRRVNRPRRRGCPGGVAGPRRIAGSPNTLAPGSSGAVLLSPLSTTTLVAGDVFSDG